MTTRTCTILCALLVTATALAVAPLPEADRIPATVKTTLAVDDPPMHMPNDVAVDSRDNVYVADGARDRLVIFDPGGKLRTATTQPAGQALKRPIGLAVDSADRLWIADTDHHRLLVLVSQASQVQEVIPLPALDEKHPAAPTGVAVTPDLKRTYVVDNANHRLLIRDNATGAITPMGQSGKAIGQFEYPFKTACGSGGDVYVVEAIGARVQILSAQNHWAGSIGSWGVTLGQFYRPKGIAVDSKGRIFVGDSTTDVVQVFDPRGRVIGCITRPDGTPLRFEHPMGMAFDRTGRLYVTELAANRVAVVALEGRKDSP